LLEQMIRERHLLVPFGVLKVGLFRLAAETEVGVKAGFINLGLVPDLEGYPLDNVPQVRRSAGLIGENDLEEHSRIVRPVAIDIVADTHNIRRQGLRGPLDPGRYPALVYKTAGNNRHKPIISHLTGHSRIE
jgi:hypothetical protein